MCRCDKTDKIISGMFVYICLAIASTVATVVIVEWLYINPLKNQQNQNTNAINSHNHTDDLYTYTTDTPLLDLPLILNVTHSEECIKECALIFLAESTVHYVNSTCYCLTIAHLNELNNIAPEQEPWYAALPSALSLNDTGSCLMPGEECSNGAMGGVCCDSAKGGDTQCLFQDYEANGTMTGSCCVKNSAFGCAHSDDCCSATRECYHGFCLRPQETPGYGDSDGDDDSATDTEHATQYDPGAAIAVPLMMIEDEAGEMGVKGMVIVVMVIMALVGSLVACFCFGCRRRRGSKGVGGVDHERDVLVAVDDEV